MYMCVCDIIIIGYCTPLFTSGPTYHIDICLLGTNQKTSR